MNGDLVEALESRGILVNDWEIAKSYTRDEVEEWNGVLWWESEETRQWVFDTCRNIVEESQTNMESLATRLDGRALARLSGMCGALTLDVKGGGALSKDVARVAWFAAHSQGNLPFDLDTYLRLQIYRGQYLDLVGFYRDQLAQSTYDDTFAPDIVEMLSDMNDFYQEIMDKEPTEFNDQVEQAWAIGNLMVMAQTISRGAFLQLEVGLRIMSSSMANQFITAVAPHFSAIWLRYDSPEWEQVSNVHYTIMHSMAAYSSIMLRNLTPVEISDEIILESADKACMDGHELSARETFHTLFGHIVRLRSLASLGIEGSRWEDAVSRAERAIEMTESLADFSHRQASLETIMSLIETGRIGDMQLYADDHSGKIDFM